MTKICVFCYPIYDFSKNIWWPIYNCCGRHCRPKHKLWRAFVDGFVEKKMKRQLPLRNIPNSRLKSLKPNPIYSQNGQNRYPIYDQNGWKTIPFEAAYTVAYTYMAHKESNHTSNQGLSFHNNNRSSLSSCLRRHPVFSLWKSITCSTMPGKVYEGRKLLVRFWGQPPFIFRAIFSMFCREQLHTCKSKHGKLMSIYCSNCSPSSNNSGSD